jgi:hypothetical protein
MNGISADNTQINVHYHAKNNINSILDLNSSAVMQLHIAKAFSAQQSRKMPIISNFKCFQFLEIALFV